MVEIQVLDGETATLVKFIFKGKMSKVMAFQDRVRDYIQDWDGAEMGLTNAMGHNQLYSGHFTVMLDPKDDAKKVEFMLYWRGVTL